MNHLINSNVRNLEISGIRKFFNLVANKEDVLSLTIGQPDFHTPDHVKEAAKRSIDQNLTTYTHNAGIPTLRYAIADFCNQKYNIKYDPDNEIIVTVGASQAIDITLRTIIQTGDEVILPGPVYPGYEPLIRLAGGIPIYVDTRENGFKLTSDLIRKHMTKRTKCVILPYPSNPTGITLTREELQAIATELQEEDVFILADEIYSELVYEQEHVSIGTFSEIREKTIIINGVSKSHSMTGWRIGFLLAPEWLTKHILKVHQYNVSCASSISQYAALEALTNGLHDSNIMKENYLERRDYVYQRLKRLDIEVIKPDGAFYFFIKLPNTKTSFELAVELVNNAKLALVPGDAFSSFGQGYLRLSYAYSLETLQKGMDRLEQYLEGK
ncbi:aminotransferase A [Aquibacillus koreensis]|uniref:Aminotransferase n=1 Tax=Aquibacillus koreensis TaxID=279446 RepID=A0A9X3WL28_9BACI|nr:aminotransferase A [Aquibacillus koreensis]MCT2534339.1 aminotransferase A [Aquibacillus koreensis]MDC3420660.1 aminotransferase A [Aquibacillus koreensis]